MTRTKRNFGEVSELPSGRFRARYTGPDGNRHAAPRTFDTKGDADVWLTLRRAEMIKEEWKPPVVVRVKPTTFGSYAEKWLKDRTLKPRTQEHYEAIVRRHLAVFAEVPLRDITPALVGDWYAELDTGPTMRAHAYSLLRTILNTAVSYDLITANPCRVRGAGVSRRTHKVRPATLPEIAALAAAMPDRYRAMTLLAAWCGLRFGELVALRRSDVDPSGMTVSVRRGVVRVRKELIEGTPKSAAGTRDVSVPPHLAPMLVDHLNEFTQPGRNGLLFPAEDGSYLSSSTLYRYFHPAREAAGRPDLRWHDLRHTGAVLAASTGATLAELMGRLGHSTPGAAMRYQHAAQGRDAIIAARLSELVESK